MRTLLLAASLTAALAAATPAALAAPAKPAPTTDVAPVTVTTPTRGADTDADAARYADAEKANPQAADFTGGATFVLIGSTTALVLALILLIVLL